MAEGSNLRPGCGSEAGLALVLVIALIVAAVAYWAWSENPPDVSTPAGSSNPPVLKPSGSSVP